MTADVRELAILPAAALGSLSSRCARLGDDGVRALREAGRRAGERLFEGLEPNPEDLSPASFWEALDERMAELRLGSVRFEPLVAGVGLVVWYRAPEAREDVIPPASDGPRRRAGEPAGPLRTDGRRPIPRCHLATGLLAGALTRVAGRPVAAMEVLCGRGDIPLCWFLIGDGDRLRGLHARLRNGASLRATLGEIGAGGRLPGDDDGRRR